MQWLGDWIQEIIIVILLAAFADLLLPNSAMQRYVKLVIGLFILLTILTPLIKLLADELDIRRLSIVLDSEASSSATLTRILNDGKKMKDLNDKQALTYAEKQLAEAIRSQVEGAFPLMVHDVTAQTALNDRGEPTIRSIRITLKGLTANEASDLETDDSQVRDIAVIEPIESIEPIRPIAALGDPVSRESIPAQADLNSDAPEEESQLKKSVQAMVVRSWDVTADAVTVDFFNPGN